jgi:GDP-L-fucose synthase
VTTKRLLLTGGSGFIGRNLFEHPALQCYEILAPRHADLELTDEDAVRSYIKNERIDLVVHSAVKPGHRNAKDASQLLATNLRMFFSLARNQDLFESLVVIGSGAIYDNRYYGAKRAEESYDEHVPVDDHGFAKYVIEKSIEGTENVFDLRVFGIYGKYEDYQIRFISNMVCKALAGLPLTIKQDRQFDYLFVDDLAPVIARVLEVGLPWPSINVTPDHSSSLVAIAQTVLEVVGRTDLPLRVAQAGQGLEYSGDNSRLREWMPALALTPLRAGIENLVTWYRENWRDIDRTKLEVDP